VKRIGGKPVVLPAQEHDRVVARISHVPQLISTMLALAVAESGSENDIALAGSGLADMTRLAASDWSVWEDICRTNGDEIASALDSFILQIESARQAIASRDFQSAQEAFRAANAFARRFGVERGGAA
jgi:prephenate dehydrogenase